MGTMYSHRPHVDHPELHETPARESHGLRNALIMGALAAAIAVGAAVALRTNPTPLQAPNGTTASGGMSAGLPAPARPTTVVLAAGTPMTVELRTRLSTKESRAGDAFTAVVAAPVAADGRTAIPEGAEISGRVAMSEQPGKASGRGKMQLQFDTVRYNGRTYDLGSRSAVFESKSGTDKDVAIIGGGAAAGGILGSVIGKDAGSAAKGAVIGGAAGTAVSLLTRGPQLTLEPGQKIRFTLDQSVAVRPSSNSGA